MKIFVKKLTGWTREVTVRNTDSLDSLRQEVIGLLREEGPLSLDQVQLIFQGGAIDQGTLGDHGVGDESVLIVVIKEKQFVRITVVVETTNKRITLQVESGETVENVKQMLSQREGHSANEQRLFFNGRELNGGRLSHHGISQSVELHLRLRTVQIFVKDTTGKTHTFDICTSNRVDNFIDQVSRKIGVQKSQLILQFAGKQLQAGCTFQSYGIQEHSTIHQHMRLRGG